MFRALGATWVLPVHHSTFRLSREPVNEPVRRFLAAAGEERWRVLPTGVGATWHLPEGGAVTGGTAREEGPA
jgi:hypothetical protein